MPPISDASLLSDVEQRQVDPFSNINTNYPFNRDFSDRIQGEDLEFRESGMSNFIINHKIDSLGNVMPPKFLTKLSSNQLITIAGAASGFLAGVVVCPLDVVKTRLQAQGASRQSDHTNEAHLSKQQRKINKKYKGFLGAFKVILRDEGVRGLYRGLVPITIGYLPTWTIYFTIYERAKNFYPKFLYEKFNLNVDMLSHFCSALTAGMASSIAVNPIWVVKTRLMIQTGKDSSIYDNRSKNPNSKIPETSKLERTYYKGTIDAFRTMYKEEGIRVFYSGLVPSLFGLLHVGIHFPVYEKLKFYLKCDVPNPTTDNHSDNRLWRLILASSISKMIASTITYPHEILRTRMQIQSSKKSSFIEEGKLLNSIIKIYRKEGLKGFYAGYTINLARTVPASAVTLVSFEYFKTYLLEISRKSLS